MFGRRDRDPVTRRPSRWEDAAGQYHAALARYQIADAALQELSRREEAAGVREETEEFLRLNDAVNAALDDLPWHLRRKLDR